LTLGWIRGNGDAVIVVASPANALNTTPVNGIVYNADTAFGNGTQIGMDNYVVYKGTADSVNITNLSPETNYQFSIYEFNSIGNCYKIPGLSGTANTSALNSTFTALVSNAWENAANWDHGIPSASTNASIASNKLAVVNSNNFQCNNLIIAPLGKLTINTAKELKVNGTLFMQSDATGTASLVNKGNLITAATEIQRYIPVTSSNEFHILASPVDHQIIDSNFSSEVENFYAWNETNGSWLPYEDNGFTLLNGGNFMKPGRGYAVTYSSTSTKNFTGNLNNATITTSLSVTPGMYAGWNLIANPFPSAINWNSASAYNRNMLEDAGFNEYAYWIWNPITGNYGTFISNGIIGTNGVSNYIAASQGFWVKAASSAGFSVNSNACEHAGQTWLKSTVIDNNTLQLKVTSDQNNYSDEMMVSFGNLNNEGGAEKMFSLYQAAPGLYSTKMNKNWSINNLTSVSNNSVVPVGFKACVDGNYTITVLGIQSFGNIVLEDLKTSTQQNLSNNNQYSFTALSTDNPNRFLLHFTATAINEVNEKSADIWYNKQIINVFNPWKEQATLSVYDAAGKLIETYAVKDGNEKYPCSLLNGVYILKLQNSQHQFVKKVVVFGCSLK
jgi:hypothetical protein